MDHRRLKQCIKVLDLRLSGRRTDAKAVAKELGVKKRTVFRDKKCLKEAAQGSHPRLRRCQELLELQYSGYQGDVSALAEKLGVSIWSIFRDLRLIEEVMGRPVALVHRRKRATKA